MDANSYVEHTSKIVQTRDHLIFLVLVPKLIFYLWVYYGVSINRSNIRKKLNNQIQIVNCESTFHCAFYYTKWFLLKGMAFVIMIDSHRFFLQSFFSLPVNWVWESKIMNCVFAIHKKSHWQVLYKIIALKNVLKFTGKHLSQSLFSIKLLTSRLQFF